MPGQGFQRLAFPRSDKAVRAEAQRVFLLVGRRRKRRDFGPKSPRELEGDVPQAANAEHADARCRMDACQAHG